MLTRSPGPNGLKALLDVNIYQVMKRNWQGNQAIRNNFKKLGTLTKPTFTPTTANKSGQGLTPTPWMHAMPKLISQGSKKVMMMKKMTLKQRIRADGHGHRDKVGSSAVTIPAAAVDTSCTSSSSSSSSRGASSSRATYTSRNQLEAYGMQMQQLTALYIAQCVHWAVR